MKRIFRKRQHTTTQQHRRQRGDVYNTSSWNNDKSDDKAAWQSIVVHHTHTGECFALCHFLIHDFSMWQPLNEHAQCITMPGRWTERRRGEAKSVWVWIHDAREVFMKHFHIHGPGHKFIKFRIMWNKLSANPYTSTSCALPRQNDVFLHSNERTSEWETPHENGDYPNLNVVILWWHRYCACATPMSSSNTSFQQSIGFGMQSELVKFIG